MLHHAHRAPGYRPHDPRETVLWRAVREHWETLVARARERGAPPPKFVDDEVRAYLACGVPAAGFLRARCGACGFDRVVAFSCKGRGYAKLRNMLTCEAPRRAIVSDVEAVVSRREARDFA